MPLPKTPLLLFLIITAFGCPHDGDPELNEDIFSDEEVLTDLDARIAEDIARQDAELAHIDRRPLTPWERCMIAATHRQQNVTATCASTPTE